MNGAFVDLRSTKAPFMPVAPANQQFKSPWGRGALFLIANQFDLRHQHEQPEFDYDEAFGRLASRDA